MSKSLDIVNTVLSTINTNKSIIKTVDSEYMPWNEIEKEAKKTPTNFPKVIGFTGGTEIPSDEQTLGDFYGYTLPVVLDIWVIKDTNLSTDMDTALKEVRDIVEDPANGRWNLSYVESTEQPFGIQRMVVWESKSRLPSPLLGVVSINFNILYKYQRTDS